MKYDRDLQRARCLALALVGFNVAGCVVGFYARRWFDAGAALVWAVNAGVWLLHIRTNQRTRDDARADQREWTRRMNARLN